MIVKWLAAMLLSKIFGDGFAADLAGRGGVYLADGVRKSLTKDTERVTSVRLTPGETYTVVARPPASRRERKLAAKQAALIKQYRSLTRPSRSQLRVARKLARVQRRLARAPQGSRRHTRRSQLEAERGLAFDRRMRPTRREMKVATELDKVTRELDELREANLASVKLTRRSRRRRKKVTIYS